jgi:hypothetical protein
LHRTDGDGHSSNLFVDEDLPSVIPGTLVEKDWLNAVQEELCNTVEDAGTTLVKGTHDQLTAIVQAALMSTTPGGRLTLSTGVSVTTSDVTGATTIRYTPHNHNRVPLFNGTTWTLKTFTELSQATTDNTKSPAAVANNSNYDMFVWNDSGTLRCTRGPAWSSDTARGTGAGTTEIELLEGRWVNKVAITNGPVAQRGLYVGTVRSDGSAQVNDSLAKRHVWNTFSRVARPMMVLESTDTWASSSNNVWRQVNGSSANQFDVVIGLSEDVVTVDAVLTGKGPDAVAIMGTGVGLDSTSAIAAGCLTNTHGFTCSVSGDYGALSATWKGFPGVGRHTLTWLEYFLTATTTATWNGDQGAATVFQSGIHGEIFA